MTLSLPGGRVEDTASDQNFRRIATQFPLGPEHLQKGLVTTGYILIRDEKAAGTDGGTFTSGAWQTRTLNTEVADTSGIASLASNQITLPAGTYRCRILVPAHFVNGHKARLRNVSDGSTLLVGSNAWQGTGASDITHSVIVGRFTLAAQKTLEVQHWCGTTRATDGFGLPLNFDGTVEVYTVVELVKEA